MPQAGFQPGSSAATLLEFEQRLKPLGQIATTASLDGIIYKDTILLNIQYQYSTKYFCLYYIHRLNQIQST